MSPSVSESTRRFVRERAQNRCEYCRMPQVTQGAEFHTEHIIPQCKGGSDTEDNLALACPSCNFHKSARTKSEDPETGQVVRLFHPRQHRWDKHFRFEGPKIVGTTPVGRATVALLDFNSERRLLIRALEQSLELPLP